jgi:hypothetical protein
LIDLGGMLGERKSDIYKLIPAKQVPISIISRKQEDYLSAFSDSKLNFPIIAKPNIGFKGFLVAKLNDKNQLINYMNSTKGEEIILQEFVDLAHEYSLLYYRIPYTKESGISSLIEKIYPFVYGDGQSTLQQLIQQFKNPFLKRAWVLDKWKSELQRIPAKGEKIILDPIGNYSRGAKFYSMAQFIDEDLLKATQQFFNKIEGMDFGRIDLKANSLEAYKTGEFKVLEINGAKSEPLHIYDPNESFLSIIKSVHRHWMIVVKIVKERRKHAFDFPSTSSGWKSFQMLKKLTKS